MTTNGLHSGFCAAILDFWYVVYTSSGDKNSHFVASLRVLPNFRTVYHSTPRLDTDSLTHIQFGRRLKNSFSLRMCHVTA